MKGYIDLTLIDLLIVYLILIVFTLAIKFMGISRERLIFIAATRMTLQLVIISYLLTFIFKNSNPWFTLIFILAMESFAIYNIFKRESRPISFELKKIIVFAMIIGTLFTTIIFMFAILRLQPWFNPRYFIPIGGMIIGNSMTSVSLGVNRMADSFYLERDKIEAALMLGATPKDAVKEIIAASFDNAMLPRINAMVGMGIVFLPGMMTGQIISGISPVSAVKYQLVIMLGIVGAILLTLFILFKWGYKTFFNSDMQLKKVL